MKHCCFCLARLCLLSACWANSAWVSLQRSLVLRSLWVWLFHVLRHAHVAYTMFTFPFSLLSFFALFQECWGPSSCRIGKKKARRNSEGLNDDEDDISRAWDDLVQLLLVVIKSEQASHKLTAQLHQATLELKDVRAERDGLQVDIQRLRESNQVCSCRRQSPVVHEPTGRP